MQLLLHSTGISCKDYTERIGNILADSDMSEDEKLFNLNEAIKELVVDPGNHSFRIARNILQLFLKPGDDDGDPSSLDQTKLTPLQIPYADTNYYEDEAELSPVQLLQRLFPQIKDPKEIQLLLEHNKYDMISVINHLSDNQQATDPQSQSQNLQPMPSNSQIINPQTNNQNSHIQPAQSKQVCRHFLAGQCYRHNCWFSHNIDVVVCKFWTMGSCMKGNECEFGHSQAAINVFQQSLPAPSSAPVKKAIIIEEDFPALGAVTAPQGSFTKNFSKVVSNGVQRKQVLQTTQKAHPLSHLGTKTKKGIKWVDTGASTSYQYMQHREEAARLCIQRNVLFEQATFAYQTGNKLSAKNLAFQAHTLNEEIAKLHEIAASTIYQSRNNHSQTNVAKEVVIDLHGLHSEEAVSCVERKVEELRKKGYQGDLNIITGTGNHSKFKAKVLPAVLAWVKQSGNRYQQGSMEDGRGGIIVVNL